MDINSASTAITSYTESGGSVSDASKLSAQERIFCDVFVSNGGKAGEAARAAGYADASADVTACKLLCRARVAERIKMLCERFGHATLPVAIQTLLAACSDEKALWKDRIKAANSLAELAGMHAPKGGLNVNVGVQVNGQQAQAIIASVHEARARRLSDIPTAMPDTLQSDIEAIGNELEADEPAHPGGDRLQGPAAAPVPLPPHSSANIASDGVSDPASRFGAIFDEGDEHGDD